MRAIILAAGLGSRFNNEIKGLLPLNNETLITRLVRQLHQANVMPVYVVVGYKAEQFLSLVENVAFIHDKNYSKGWNSYSLKAALDTIGFEDTLMLDADVILTDDLLPKLVDSFNGESISLVDMSVTDEEAMKLVIQDNRIIKYSKEEGVGAEVCTIVSKDKLKEIYKDLGLFKWWGVGPNTTGFNIVEINNDSKWMDVDTPDEYELAKQTFKAI